jgi:predicted ArsR family transcriptional regulator
MTVDTMETTSRQKVLESVRKYQSITVAELSHSLKMTPANIRHHLSILKSEGLIERMEVRQLGGRGRPEEVFGINRVFKEDGLGNLIEGILHVWRMGSTTGEYYRKIRELGIHLGGIAQISQLPGITIKLTKCIAHLNLIGYQAHWEAGISGPRFTFWNCPYQKIIQRHPEICFMDTVLLEELTALSITQVEKLERDERGLSFCGFTGN